MAIPLSELVWVADGLIDGQVGTLFASVARVRVPTTAYPGPTLRFPQQVRHI